MKKLGYILFGFIFHISRIFPVQKRKVVLFNGHNHGLNGNLLEIKRALEREKSFYRVLFYAKRDLFEHGFCGKLKGAMQFFLVLPFQMATASCICLNDNFLPLGWCNPSKQTKVVQLWHGAGAFKKFGLSTEQNETVRRQVMRANTRLTHLFVTSKQIVPFYQEAFGISKERIFATGLPVTDIYFREDRKAKGRERFYQAYPELKDKKLLLYTPTFRRSKEENFGIMEHFSVEQIHNQLGDTWVILVKMHPKYPVDNIPENSFCYNMTNYSQITDLYFVSDMLVTDYSSTIVEYVLLDKPVILYAYDLKEYDRGFYWNYEETVPGPVAHNQKELIEFLENVGKEIQKRQTFAKLQYDYRDSDSAARILSVLEDTEERQV